LRFHHLSLSLIICPKELIIESPYIIPLKQAECQLNILHNPGGFVFRIGTRFKAQTAKTVIYSRKQTENYHQKILPHPNDIWHNKKVDNHRAGC